MKKYKAQASNHLLLRYNAHIILKYASQCFVVHSQDGAPITTI